MIRSIFKRVAGVVHLNILPVMLILFLISVSCSEKKVPEGQRAYLTPEIMCGTVQFADGFSPKLDILIGFGIALIHHMT